MKRLLLIGAALVSFALVSCTTYVRPDPPPVRVEVKPTNPYTKAVWVPGHWKWKNRKVGYVWIPGHWKRVR